VFARERGAGNRAGVVVKTDQGIELALRGGRIANRTGNFGGVDCEIAGKPRIALFLRPHSVGTNALALSEAFAGRTPAYGPRLTARAGIGIGFNQTVPPQPCAAFKALDQRNAIRTDFGRRAFFAAFPSVGSAV